MRRLAALVAVALLAGCGGDGPSATTTTSTTRSAQVERSDAVLADLDPDAPGCAAAVSVDGDVVWHGAVGMARLDPPAPIDDHTVFDIGSTSKQFTATAVLLLVQEGKLDLDASLRTYVTDLPAWADRTSISQLLHHTSGVPDYIGLLDAEYADRTTVRDALVALRAVDELEFEPGSEFSYSNSGYFLLSQVVEAVTGQTLAVDLAANVFAPLALDAVMDPVPDIAERATSYEDGNVADSLWEQTGDGAIQTTPVQLVKWATQYWDPTVGGTELLRARSAGAVDQGDGDRYGAGIVISEDDDGATVLTHDGSWAGFVTGFVVRPEERLAAAVTCNDADLDPSTYAFDLIDVWFEH